MPRAATGREIVGRKHPEYAEHVDRWRWLLDSLEGGERYRKQVYPSFGTTTRRNLVRHKHERARPVDGAVVAVGADGSGYGYDRTASPGDGGHGPAEDDDYLLRLERTPVPLFVEEVIEAHLSEIYGREVTREFPDPELAAWSADVDGTGTTLDEWIADAVAPTLLCLGQLDFYADRPAPPAGAAVLSRADARRYGTDRVVAQVILPENLPWWESDPLTGRYVECTVRETAPDGTKSTRHWTATQSTLYRPDGEVISVTPHPYGRVPIERAFDRRKVRCRNVGRSRYDGIAELQRESYNLESELILTNSREAHPLLQAPEDFFLPDAGHVPIGPGFVLPKRRSQGGGGAVTYEPWEVLDIPTGPAGSIREDLKRHRDAVDRAARLTKPAGVAGTGGTTVAQSGISKALDQKAGNALLKQLGVVLARAEYTLVGLVLTVLYAGDAARVAREVARTRVAYPGSFNLLSAEEKAGITTAFQGGLAEAGRAPKTEARLLQSLMREGLPGLDDDEYGELDAEIEAAAGAGTPAPAAFAGGSPSPAGPVPGPAVDGQQEAA